MRQTYQDKLKRHRIRGLVAIATVSAWAVLVLYVLGPYAHELINSSIAGQFGLSSQIIYGAHLTDDCPWACSPLYVSYWATSFNGTEYALLNSTEKLELNNEVDFNEHPIGQALPSTLLMLIGIVWEIAYLNVKSD